MADPQVAPCRVVRVTREGARPVDDVLVVERALEIRVDGQALSVTLRTPGHDRELTLGFLAAEGVIRARSGVLEIVERPATCADAPDVAEVTLAPGTRVDWARFERHFASTSACGLCGRAHLDSLRAGLVPVDAGFRVRADALLDWGGRPRDSQAAFALTGGLHAAAFAADAVTPELVREDVGRHNAVDKIVGALLERGDLPVRGGVLWVSGRAGAEIVLKAARAGIPVLAAVGAPSTLAVELAGAARMTLIGFLRDGRMNVYTGAERVELASAPGQPGR
jgi:FdhD protein